MPNNIAWLGVTETTVTSNLEDYSSQSAYK
jgi:hypothetical protein